MADYTIKNLKHVENQAEKFGLAPDVEARFARDDLDCEQIGVSYQRLAANARQPFAHKHGHREELYVVVSGSGTALLDGEVTELRPWDAIRMAPSTLRTLAAGPEGLEFLAFGPYGTDDVESEPAAWPGEAKRTTPGSVSTSR
jgi:mannose-6-phosphate isomerase-like protein (cupin superfamily)